MVFDTCPVLQLRQDSGPLRMSLSNPSPGALSVFATCNRNAADIITFKSARPTGRSAVTQHNRVQHLWCQGHSRRVAIFPFVLTLAAAGGSVTFELLRNFIREGVGERRWQAVRTVSQQ